MSEKRKWLNPPVVLGGLLLIAGATVGIHENLTTDEGRGTVPTSCPAEYVGRYIVEDTTFIDELIPLTIRHGIKDAEASGGMRTDIANLVGELYCWTRGEAGQPEHAVLLPAGDAALSYYMGETDLATGSLPAGLSYMPEAGD